jgi:hypothetical protein
VAVLTAASLAAIDAHGVMLVIAVMLGAAAAGARVIAKSVKKNVFMVTQ